MVDSLFLIVLFVIFVLCLFMHMQLVEEYTGHWQVPLPQLKVLWTALCSFTKATAAFPDDCQHVHYVLSSLAL